MKTLWNFWNRRWSCCMVLTLLAVMILGSFSDTASAVSVDDFVARRFTNSAGILPYRLFLPTNYDSTLKYPLVLFLHGAGECGTDNRNQLVGQTGALVFVAGTNQARYPSFMVAPQCPNSASWSDTTRRAQVFGLMTALKAEFSLDLDRLYITGLSLGGNGTWDFITQYPTMYAAAIPMSGWGTISLAPKITRLPIWNFHAANDPTVAVSNSRTMVDAVRKAGGNPIYTEYANGGHVVWTPAYATPILVDWLYAQKRGSTASVPPILSINLPTNQPSFASDAAKIALSGTARDGSTGPASVTWTNYRPSVVGGQGSAQGTTDWSITNLTLFPAYTNVILVTGKGTSWSTSLGGYTTFNDLLTVIFPPFITSQPASQVVKKSDGATLTVAINQAASNLRYQWRLNGTNLPGETSSALTLANPRRADGGLYSVVVANAFGSVTSAEAKLRVLVPQQVRSLVIQADGSTIMGCGDSDGGLLTQADQSSFQVWSSTNLVTWEPLTTELSVSNGMVWLSGSGTTNLSSRFYRFEEKEL